VSNYLDIQNKKLVVEEINAHNMGKELELSQLSEEAKLMLTWAGHFGCPTSTYLMWCNQGRP
jgi:hypothetical protein